MACLHKTEATVFSAKDSEPQKPVAIGMHVHGVLHVYGEMEGFLSNRCRMGFPGN